MRTISRSMPVPMPMPPRGPRPPTAGTGIGIGARAASSPSSFSASTLAKGMPALTMAMAPSTMRIRPRLRPHPAEHQHQHQHRHYHARGQAHAQVRAYRSYVRIQTGPPSSSPAAAASSSTSTSTTPTPIPTTATPAAPPPSSARIPLTSSVFGHATSRGTRPYQEDAFSVSCLEVPSRELRNSLRMGGRIAQEAERRWRWSDSGAGEDLAGQLAWWGIFDGHGGSATSRYLAAHLHQIFERVTPDMVTDTVQATREHGGYFRRFGGGVLERWVRKEELRPVRGGGGGGARAGGGSTTSTNGGGGRAGATGRPHPIPPAPKHARDMQEDLPPWEDHGLTQSVPPPDGMEAQTLTLAERATLAFLVADRHILAAQAEAQAEAGAKDEANGKQAQQAEAEQPDPVEPESVPAEEEEARPSPSARGGGGRPTGSGSTATVLTLHSLDAPPTVWYDSDLVFLGVWHVGDTRLLLTRTSDGSALPLTTSHHPDIPSESDRLRRLGAGIVTDSFGEARWMGALANTRALGDGGFKAAGVTPEPEVLSRVLHGSEYAHAVLISDGVGSVMSDQEAVDLVRGARKPQEAARRIVGFAEELGAEDNCTVVVVPLKGWGKVGGEDRTRKQREYRRSKVDLYRDHRQ